MPIIKPRYSKAQVDRAGNVIRSEEDVPLATLQPAYDAMSNWRASHAVPLEKLATLLRRHASAVADDPIVSQRLKRGRSIASKLWRSSSRLSQMQDIAGCRAVVENVAQVRGVVERLKRSKTSHELVRLDDYLDAPKSSGYRSVHLVYRFNSEAHKDHCGLFCEAQVRTRRQHAWATAVEVTGFFRDEELKNGAGNKHWLRFFYLISSGIAMMEGMRALPDAPSDLRELRYVARGYLQDLDVVNWLSGFEHTLKSLGKSSDEGCWYLIEYDAKKNRFSHQEFSYDDFDDAHKKYRELETKHRGEAHRHVVMVTSSSFDDVKAAYPSFFSDTRLFRGLISELLNLDIRFESKDSKDEDTKQA